MNANISIQYQTFSIEPDKEGLPIEFVFLPNDKHSVLRVPMRIKGTVETMVRSDMTGSQLEAAAKAVRESIAASGQNAGALLSAQGKEPEDLLCTPALANGSFDVSLITDANLTAMGIGFMPGKVKITSATLDNASGASGETSCAAGAIAAETADPWICPYCDTTGLTGNFCPQCGAPRESLHEAAFGYPF